MAAPSNLQVEKEIDRGCSAVEPSKSLFGKYSDTELLNRLKRLALNPCGPEVSLQNVGSLLNQALRVREVLSLGLNDCPRRKRKLELFVREQLRSAPKVAFELFDQENEGKKSRRLVSDISNVSCVIGSVRPTKGFDQKTVSISQSAKSLVTSDECIQEPVIPESCVDAVDTEIHPKYMSFIVDSDESVNGSNPLSPVDLTLATTQGPMPALNEAIDNSKSLVLRGPRTRRLPSSRLSPWLLNLIGDQFQRMVVPIGPRFQADVPEWTGPHGNGKADHNPDDSRWLGTKVWPIETDNRKSSTKPIGKGREELCTCQSPGSVDCVRRHVLEESLLLQRELGPAFTAWKFDEMGEQMVKSWTSKEQQTFQPLVKVKQQMNGKNFLKHAFKSIPSKFRTTVINYYFNVFIPRRISTQTRMSSAVQINTDDDDEEGDSNYLHLPNRRHGKSVMPENKSNDETKTRYLRLRK